MESKNNSNEINFEEQTPKQQFLNDWQSNFKDAIDKMSKRSRFLFGMLTQKEFELFKRLASLSFDSGIIPNDFKNEIKFNDLLLLKDAGLLSYENDARFFFNIDSKKGSGISFGDKFYLRFSNDTNVQKEIYWNGYLLTPSGLEIKKLLDITMNLSNIKKVALKAKSNFPDFRFSLYNIISKNDANIKCSNQDLLL